MRLALLLPVLAACSDTAIKVIKSPPTADIVLPADGDSFVAERDTVAMVGQVGDEDQAPEELTVLWLSNRDGQLVSMNADSDGVASADLAASALTVGAHTLTLAVSDDDGGSDQDEVQIEILPADAPPDVSVLSPEDGAEFDAGQDITFEGQASDARTDNADLIYEWESDTAGVLDSGALSSAGTSTFTTDALGEGEHTLTFRVTDTDGYAGEAEVRVVVNHVNEPPSASITAPANGAGERTGQNVTFEGLLSDPEDGAEALAAAWTSDLDGPLYSGNADSTGLSTFTTSALSTGLHTITLTVTDTAGASAFTTINFEIYERNTPPGAPEIQILPASPDTTDALVVSIVTDATDDDGDPVSYTWQWYRDSALMSGYTTDTVAASRTNKGEIWMVEVTATDGEDAGGVATAEVLVLNTPPSISAVDLSPGDATTLDTLTCTPAGWSDDDGDAEDYLYSWTVDGAAVTGSSNTLSGAFKKNQEVVCTATPWDGEEAGAPLSSGAVTIVNSPPTAPTISLDPVYPVTGDDLVVVEDTSASDADGDALSTTYVWMKNGTVKSSYTTDTVGASATTLEDEWSVYVIVDDGDETDTSDTATARIWPDVGDLLVTEFMPDPDTTSDQRGEWLEIYNNSSLDINLDGHYIEDLDYDHAALDGLTLDSGDWLVVCVEDDPTQNGGVTCDLEVRRPSYGTCSGTDCMLLGNSDDEIIIENPAGTVDGVSYTSSWVTAGEATGLDDTCYDEASNDSKSCWCSQSTSISSGGDQGTPGGTNGGC